MIYFPIISQIWLEMKVFYLFKYVNGFKIHIIRVILKYVWYLFSNYGRNCEKLIFPANSVLYEDFCSLQWNCEHHISTYPCKNFAISSQFLILTKLQGNCEEVARKLRGNFKYLTPFQKAFKISAQKTS